MSNALVVGRGLSEAEWTVPLEAVCDVYKEFVGVDEICNLGEKFLRSIQLPSQLSS